MQDPLIGVTPLYLVAMAFLLAALGLVIKNAKFFKVFALVNTVIAFMVSVYIIRRVVDAGIQLYFFGGYPAPLGIAYEVDELNALLGLLATSIMLLSCIYSAWYMKHPRAYLYYTLFLTLLAGSLGCLYTGDYFNFFVMLEVLSLSSYALVAYFRDSPKSIEAAIRFAFVGIVSSSFYLLSAFIAYASFGTLTMADIALKARNANAVTQFSEGIVGNIVMASAMMMALATWTWTFKAAVFPNYFWLPDAAPEAPIPISAVFVGVIDLIGVYGAIRMFYTLFGWGSVASQLRPYIFAVLQILGAVSVFIAAFLLLIQEDVKRFIAYSTISHLGLIFMALSLDVAEGVSASLLHTISNSFAESLLFYSVGVAIVSVGRSINVLGALRRYRVALAGIVIAILNLIGVPPLLGFWSKYLIFKAFLDTGRIYGIVILVLATGISAIGYFKILFNAFRPVGGLREDARLRNTALADIAIVLCIAALITIGALYMISPGIREFTSRVGYKVTCEYKAYYEFLSLGS
uniref:NADH:quinone oxidoreductase/Mrp antiporter transmembrane domain-containing protein n=1 Tax=Ignisphaera aggregans TaxID=334771 RepID=A0A7C4BBU6_9CREN